MLICNFYTLFFNTRNAIPSHIPPYASQYAGISKCGFFRCRDVACRVSMFAIAYKTLNVNGLYNQIVETQNFASLLPH